MMKLKSRKNKTGKPVCEEHQLGQRIFSPKVFFFIAFLSCLLVHDLYGQAPTITAFTPTNGSVGTVVNITGTNLNTTSANNIVFFGATQAIVTAATSTQLTVTVPTGATYASINVLNTGTGLLAYSTTNFTPTFMPNKGSITTSDFSTKLDFTAGTNPYSVAIGDLDGDGKADLAVANTNNSTVSVFRNTGSSGTVSYATKVDLATGINPNHVEIGDLDGDGKADLAVTNGTSATVSVFRNTGSSGTISYATKVDFATGVNPKSIAIGDLDGDGKADLALANAYSATVSVFRNTGSIGIVSYAPKVDYTTGSFPWAVAIGDLDGDNKTDLAVANYGSTSVSVFRNTGSSGTISYAPKVDFTTGLYAYHVAAGDLDGDGKTDLAVANGNGTSVCVFRNTGSSGTVSFATKVDFATAGSLFVTIGDLDGDGKADMATVNQINSVVSVFRNTGSSGTISYATKVDFVTGTNPIAVAIGDLDGDGKADLTVANSATASNSISIIRNNPVFSVPPPVITSFTPTSGPIGTTVTITGTNFSTTLANNTVQFNGTTAVVTASTSTSIITTVPTGATNGKISVTVAGNTATSASDFAVTTTQNFITQWNLATAGSGITQLSFGTATSGAVNYTWQELSPGSATGSGSWSGATLNITGLPTGATIRLQIAPTNFQRIIINNGLDRSRLTQVEQWGSIPWTSMQDAFDGCANLQVTATDAPNLTGVTNMSEMFRRCSNLNSPTNIGSWNTGTVTNMVRMFSGASVFNQNIGAWNTEAVTTMQEMFSGSSVFNQNIGTWNTGAVTTMEFMFYQAFNFNQNIGAWNTSAVTNMSTMFSEAASFNQNIGAWNTGAVTDMSGMFQFSNAFNQNIGTWTLNPSVDLRFMLSSSGMNCNNYSATLIAWNGNPSTPNGRTLGAIQRPYGTNAVAARTNLTTTKGWTITGDAPSGLVCSSSSVITITTQPANFSFCFGQTPTATFTTNATGTSNITYQWQKFNTSLSLFENVTDNANYSGATSNTLVVTAATSSLTGDYRCAISGDFALSTFSNNATLTVLALPSAPITTNTSNNGCGTQSLTLKATASGAGTYQWFENNTTSFSIYSDATGDFATPELSATATYYVSFSDGTCESAKVPVTGTITNAGPGTIDPAFVPAANSPGNWSAIDDMAIQPDGKFVLNYFETAGVEYLMCRLLPDGTLDPSFTQRSRTLFDGLADVVTLQSDGKILSGGRFTLIGGTPYGRIVRLNADGSIDGSFANGSGFDDAVVVINQQSDNKIIVGGSFTTYNGVSANSIIRLNSNGSRDSGFTIGTGFNAQVSTIVVRSDGKILVGGNFTTYNGSTVAGIVLLNSDGTLDNTFAATGLTNVAEIALQSDGKILLYSNEGFLRLNADGTPDTSFNTGTGFNSDVNAIYCEPSGKILVAGDFQSFNGVTRNFVARLNPNGSLDKYFDTGIGSYTWTYKILPSGTDHVFVVGYFDFWNNIPQNAIARIDNACIRTPVVSNSSSCGATITLSACGGFNGDYRWYTTSTGGSPIAGETNSSITINNLTATTTYYVTLNDGVCESARTQVVATLNSPLNAPTTTGFSSCGSGAVTLTASGGSNGQYRWYTVDTGGTALTGEVNSSYTSPLISTTTTYYVSISDGTCESTRTSVIATINSALPAPTITGGSSCGTGAVTLTASGGSTGQYRWYTLAAGGIALAGEVNSSYTSPSISTTTTYYVSINDGTCESTRTSVIATINTPPSATTTTGGSSCGPSAVTINASGGTNGQYRWYTAATGGTAITGEVNSSYTTPSLATTTTYFVAINDGTCESTRTSVTATINILPPAPIATSATGCSSTSVTLTASGGTSGQYRWYTQATGGTSIDGATNTIYATPSLTTTTTYFVSVNDGTCESARTPVVANITTCSTNLPPVIQTTSITIEINGEVTFNLLALISDPDNNIDLTKLTIVSQPISGAFASIDANQNLIIDYSATSYTGTDELIIEVCDLAGSCVQQKITIQVEGDIITYNGISANGDSQNSIFEIRNIDILEETKNNRVSIYNRWGSKVFEVENYNNTTRVFTGLNQNGDELPSGTYFYKIEFNSGRKSENGYLTLKK